ncbi:cilia- and flagella-associated protein 144-like isoform X2 [Tachypleus tridentatus]
MTTKNTKDPDAVMQQAALLNEMIKRERRYHKLYTTFNINPHKKGCFLAGKPHTIDTHLEGKLDDGLLDTITSINKTPCEKYDWPVTESQTIGWFSKPLVDLDRTDRRMYFPKINSEVTKFMEAAWKLKEQSENVRVKKK